MAIPRTIAPLLPQTAYNPLIHATLNTKASILFPGTFSQAGAEHPCHPLRNAALASPVAHSQNTNVCDDVLSCVTLSHMAKHISIRLWDDVLEAVDKLAAVEERDRSQVINRTLRAALHVPGSRTAAGIEALVSTQKISGEPSRKRKACQHGNDPLSCERPACRQARNV